MAFCYAGLYILQKLPDSGIILPTGFKKGSRAEFEKTMKTVRKEMREGPVAEWEEFAKSVPKNDDVQDYLREHPDAFYIPFKELLFNRDQIGEAAVAPIVSRRRVSDPPTEIATESVAWSNRGDRCVPCNEPVVPINRSTGILIKLLYRF